MIFIEGKFLEETIDVVWDTANLWFEFDLPNGEKYITKFDGSSGECFAAYDEDKEKIEYFIRSKKDLKRVKAKLESERRKAIRKELRKETKSSVALHYLQNSTIPDDEEYEEFYEDETCYSDEEFDELEERYFR